MAATMQEALLEAGLINGTEARRSTRKAQTLAPEPARAAKLPGLPSWLIKERIQFGRVSDLIEALGKDKEVYLVHSSNQSYSQVVEITPRNNPQMVSVLLGGEDKPRTFRLAAEVRYVITKGR